VYRVIIRNGKLQQSEFFSFVGKVLWPGPGTKSPVLFQSESVLNLIRIYFKVVVCPL